MSSEEPMDILQVSTRDVLGGAERVAWDLFDRFRTLGHESRLAVGYKVGNDPDVTRISHQASCAGWRGFWWRMHTRLQPAYGRFPGSRSLCRFAQSLAEPGGVLDRRRGIEDFNFPGTNALLDSPPRRPDILHLHNLHGKYFDLRELPRLSHEVPTVITLHDAWLISGHCAHSFDCDRWRTGCGSCPDLSIYPSVRRDATAHNWRRKREILSRCRLHVATPCRWLMRKVEQSILAPAIVESRVIPYGVDRTIFRPADRATARKSLGIQRHQHVILFAANGIRRNVFKDYALIHTVAKELARATPKRNVLFLGLGEDVPQEQFGSVRLRFVPPECDRRMVARYYQSADIFFHAARADTFPNAILEALACGTPVVATAVGGIPEQVRGLSPESPDQTDYDESFARQRATGMLVPPGSTTYAALAIMRLLDNESLRQELGRNAAADAANRFDLTRHADDYLAWYEHLLRPIPTSPRNETLSPRAVALAT